jgi:hypothetical protein
MTGFRAELGDVDGAFVFGADNDRQLDLTLSNLQFGDLAHRGFPF